jgi:hypothetical protein
MCELASENGRDVAGSWQGNGIVCVNPPIIIHTGAYQMCPPVYDLELQTMLSYSEDVTTYFRVMVLFFIVAQSHH